MEDRDAQRVVETMLRDFWRDQYLRDFHGVSLGEMPAGIMSDASRKSAHTLAYRIGAAIAMTIFTVGLLVIAFAVHVAAVTLGVRVARSLGWL